MLQNSSHQISPYSSRSNGASTLPILRAWLGFIICLVSTFIGTANAQDLEFHLVDGNILTAEPLDHSFAWKTVSKNGSVRDAAILWKSVKTLQLTNTPSSRQAAEVGRLLKMLASDDYLDRESAEAQLANAEISGGFRDIVLAFKDDPDMEVRIRVARILAELKSADKKQEIKFDSLSLDRSETLQGDAGNFQLRVSFRGKEIVILRRDVLLIRQPQARKAESPTATLSPTVEVFQTPDNHFYQPGQTIVDFSSSPSGEELNRRDIIENSFIPWGIKFGCEEAKGNVVVSSYNFATLGKMPKDNSIAIYDSVTTPPKRFKGIMTIDFCLPNMPSVSAGVREFGAFLAIVENGRDFILEGYNAQDQLIVTVESPTERCGFVGFKSNEPVTHIRILSNPYLFRIDRTVDDDYGIDHVCFSKPELTSLKKTPTDAVRLKNGNLLLGDGLKLSQDKVTISNSRVGSISFATADVAEIGFAKMPANESSTKGNAKGKANWFVTLDDGSQLHAEVGSSFKLPTLGRDLKPTQISALHNQQTVKRFPLKGDGDKPILVFPTCRIPAKNFKLTDAGFEWNSSSQKLIQPVDDENPLGVNGKDPTPTNSKIIYGETTSDSLPTVWLKDAVIPSSAVGLLQTKSGEQIAFGDGTNFKLNGIEKNQLMFSGLEKSFTVDMENVQTLRWPNK